MYNRRRQLQQQIRATREWLNKAELSLSREEDLRGDLNLMLARAELSRVTETQCGSVKSGLKFCLPKVAAFAVALSMAFFINGWGSTEEAAPSSATVAPTTAPETVSSVADSLPIKLSTKQPTNEAITSPTADSGAAPVESTEEFYFIPDATPESPPISENGAAYFAEPEIPTTTEVSPPVEDKSEPEYAPPPSAEMQKLMQHAGQVLRES